MAKSTEVLGYARALNDQPPAEKEKKRGRLERAPKVEEWRSLEQLTESYEVPTIVVPSADCHSLLNSNMLRDHLATRMEELGALRPRIRLVRDITSQHSLPHPTPLDFDDDGKVLNRKLLLLNPSTVSADSTQVTHNNLSKDDGTSQHDKAHQYHDSLRIALPGLPLSAVRHLAELEAVPGPNVTVHVPYSMQPASRILSKIMPAEALPPPASFEQVGHVAHLNLKPRHEPYAYLIGDVILERLSPTVRTVVNKVGEVHGLYRTYDMEVLAGEDNTVVEVVEDGARLSFDLRLVYWCTRLSGERQRLLREEFRKGDFIADAFCGVGALCVLAATKLGCVVAANDINPDAVAYCKTNAKQNGVSSKKFTVNCGDAYDFLQSLGLAASEGRSPAMLSLFKKGDSPHVGELPNHVIMNYPLDSPRFLGALRWWPSQGKMKVVPRIHLYTFARGEGGGATEGSSHDGKTNDDYRINGKRGTRDSMEVAIDLVGEGLIPKLGSEEETQSQRDLLNSLGCDVRAREVRDVAPGKVVICVSFSVTRDLLRVMQGDYGN